MSTNRKSMKDLTITKIRAIKEKLEADILILIFEMEKNTGLMV